MLRDLGFDAIDAGRAIAAANGDIESAVETLMDVQTAIQPVGGQHAESFVDPSLLRRRSDSRCVNGDSRLKAPPQSSSTDSRRLDTFGLPRNDTELLLAELQRLPPDSSFQRPETIDPLLNSTIAPFDGLMTEDSEPSVLKYAAHLRVLSDLGFADAPLNLSLLEQYSGDIEKVIEQLDVPSIGEPKANGMIEDAIGPHGDSGDSGASRPIAPPSPSMPPVPAVEPPPELQISMMLSQLSRLGFRDKPKNRETLERFDWNLDRTLDYLLGEAGGNG